MNKVLWIFCTFLIQVNAFATNLTCLDKLLPYSRHSGLHQLSREEWDDGKTALDAQSALAALNSLTSGKLLCKRGEVKVKIDPVCMPVIVDIFQSNVCYLHTNLGYFLISKDNGRTTNFIFSRDNRFSTP